MGYSGLDIFNGDLPMDVRYDIMTRIGAKEDDDGNYKAPKGTTLGKLLSEKQDDLMKYLKRVHRKNQDFEKTIPLLVLGAVMINHGAAIDDKTMKAVLKACDEDQWAQSNIERRLYINDFKKILSSYDHKTPTNEYIDHGAKFGVTSDDMMHDRFSGNVAKMALYHVREAYRQKEWFRGVTLIFGESGYALLIGVEFNEERTPNKARQALQGMFGIPLYIMGDPKDLNTDHINSTTDDLFDKVKAE